MINFDNPLEGSLRQLKQNDEDNSVLDDPISFLGQLQLFQVALKQTDPSQPRGQGLIHLSVAQTECCQIAGASGEEKRVDSLDLLVLFGLPEYGPRLRLVALPAFQGRYLTR